MTENNIPAAPDDDPVADGDVPLSDYDALPDEPESIGQGNEFEGIDITDGGEGPDIEGGNDLDTGAGGGQRKRDL